MKTRTLVVWMGLLCAVLLVDGYAMDNLPLALSYCALVMLVLLVAVLIRFALNYLAYRRSGADRYESIPRGLVYNRREHRFECWPKARR